MEPFVIVALALDRRLGRNEPGLVRSNLAADGTQSAEGGEILVSQAVHDRVVETDGIELRPARVVELKGLPGAHQLFAVGSHQ